MEQPLESASEAGLTRLTADVVAAYVSNNAVPAGQLADLIRSVHSSLSGLTVVPAEAKAEPLKPAIAVRKSINPDYLVCLEDGKKLKTLKRHLKTAYDLTPEQYRERWGLAPEYPMVAPNYAAHRSALARQIGLGTLPRGRR